jgi:phosphosulfolactate synthase
MSFQTHATWNDSFIDPSTVRTLKPREKGITMIIDKGLGLASFLDVLQTSSSHIDFIKLGFGTSVLYPQSILKDKIKLAKEHQVSLYPGGTFFEVAFAQGKMKEYFNNLIQWGFDTVEISDGSISLTEKERKTAIKMGKELGLQVLTECGKKENGSSLDLFEIKDTLHQDLTNGADYMIIEGRESGENVGIYDAEGEADMDLIHSVKETMSNWIECLLWEAPQKDQQTTLLKHFGPNVNLGNIATQDIYSLESLRRGLRSDTFYLIDRVNDCMKEEA